MRSAAAQPNVSKDKAKSQEKAVESTSFAMNLFRGQLKLDEIFPYPSSLTEEQRENLQALVDPTAKFFEVISGHIYRKISFLLPGTKLKREKMI